MSLIGALTSGGFGGSGSFFVCYGPNPIINQVGFKDHMFIVFGT